MAERKSKPGTPLVIVESPAKARTISRFLGKNYTVEASIGHIRDLPGGAKEIPEAYKKEEWAYLGVNVNEDFTPVYIVPREKSKQVRKLKDLLKGANELYLATDEDREGEAISWHLVEVLNPKVPVFRLVFHEITEEAIRAALSHPRQIDEALVRAQETRRIVDRLYGYEVSPLLWRKIRPRLSAGRVQSVAVRLIVDRERDRMAFVPATYWDLLGQFATTRGEAFEAELVSVDGRAIPSSRDFDSTTGKLKDPSRTLLSEIDTKRLIERLSHADCRVVEIEDKPYVTRPYPPFTTSTLQQEANRKYGFTARTTMQLAQSLYETGHITYMRTDSTNLAAVAIQAARDLVQSQYGAEYLPARPPVYQTKVKNAQEAHEAIRPAGHPFDFPEALRAALSPDAFRLYDLIWKRTVASQMTEARGRRIMVTVEMDGALFQVSGKTIEFPGYLRAYVEGSDDPEAELADREVLLPSVSKGETLVCRRLDPKSHTTQPSNRYSEAALTRALEEMGIGRPSTYASIIETILAREYVFKRGGALVPTWTAFAVVQLLEKHLPSLVDYQFTAEMEDQLDAISRGEEEHVRYLRRFYFGNGHSGLKQQLLNKVDEIDARDVSRISVGTPDQEAPIFIRVGRYGPFLEQGERRASLPDKMAPDEVTMASAREMLDKAGQTEEPLGICPDTHKPVFMKIGRFGPYVQRGTTEDEEKPQNASLLKGMQPESVDLGMALKLLSLPRHLGLHPQTNEPVEAQNGRFGPYVRSAAETRSLPADLSPLDVTLEQALDLLSKPKTGRRAAGGAALREFEASPVTSKPVVLKAGRFGPYVTDGQTNASLPRDLKPEELTFPMALDLLKARAEKLEAEGGAPQRGRRPSPRKAAAKPAAAAKSTAPVKKAKKPAAKKPAKKAAKKAVKKAAAE